MATLDGPAAPRQQYNMGYVWAISLVAALGGLMFGYDWVVISGTEPFYERFFNVASAAQEGWAMGSALVGCLLGAILSGGLSDRFGRKRLLILAALVFVVSSLGTALADSVRGVQRLADRRRRGHRPGLEPLAHVHRRDRPGGRPRPAGGHEPVHHRDRASCWPRWPTSASTTSTRGPTGNRSPPPQRPCGRMGRRAGSPKNSPGKLKRSERPAVHRAVHAVGRAAMPPRSTTRGWSRSSRKSTSDAGESRRSTPATISRWRWRAAA